MYVLENISTAVKKFKKIKNRKETASHPFAKMILIGATA